MSRHRSHVRHPAAESFRTGSPAPAAQYGKMQLPVTVTIDGAIVPSSEGAELVRGTVVGPVAPFLEAVAGRITYAADGSIVLERGGLTVRLRLTPGTGHDRFVPLAPSLRGLGYVVRFDGLARVLKVTRPAGAPIRSPALQRPAAGPYETFVPAALTTPTRAAPSLEPRPRRTPILEPAPPAPVR